jgi:hypothetical protein
LEFKKEKKEKKRKKTSNLPSGVTKIEFNLFFKPSKNCSKKSEKLKF